MRILLIPTSDWLGHPIPSRLHFVFDKVATRNDVHVLRFAFYPNVRLKTTLKVHEIDDKRVPDQARYYVINAPRHYEAIKRIVTENHIDIVVISNLLSGYIGAKAARSRTTVFDLADHFPTSGAGYYFDVRSFLGKLAATSLEALLRSTLRNVDQIVVCSEALQYYVKSMNISRRVSLIPNGVSDFFFAKQWNGKTIREKYGMNSSTIVGYIGSIEFWLNMHPLLEAVKRLNRIYDVKLLLVGGRLKTKKSQEVSNQIRRMGIEANVKWIGFVPYDSVPAYIASMDIGTIPFDHTHPTAYYSAPNKLLEYFALEKPVIATPIPDIVLNAEKFVHFATTAEDYVNEIRNCIENKEECQELARNSRKLAEQRSWTKIAQDYENLLKSALDNRNTNK